MNTNDFDELVRKQNSKVIINNDYTIGVNGFDELVKKTNRTNLTPIVRTPPGYIKQKDPIIGKQTFLSQAKNDTRKEDTYFTRLGRFVLPTGLESAFGISEKQRKPAEKTMADRIQITGNALTIEQMRNNPKDVAPAEYFRSGLSFGNNLTKYLPGYEYDIDPSDLPEPTTGSQKLAYAAGSILTMTLAQPLIESAAVGLISKIPGGAGILTKITDAAKLSPWKIGYPMAITKAGIEGGLFGLITDNKKTVAQNTLETAGTFAAFSALAFPVVQFFKPILSQVGKMEVANPKLKNLLGEVESQGPTVSDTIWFRNPNDKTQILKVTREGIMPGSTEEMVQAGVKVTDVSTLSKVEIEAFKENPSLYGRLKEWLGGKKIEVKFNEPPVNETAVIKTLSKEEEILKDLRSVKQEANQTPSPRNTFVTVVNEKTGIDKVYRINENEFQSIIDKVDNTRGKEIAGQIMPDGNQYHITTKPLSSLEKSGKIYSGAISLKDLPNIETINAEKPEGNEPFDIKPTVKDRTPFAIKPSGIKIQEKTNEPFIKIEDGKKEMQLISEDINAKIQEKADSLLENVENPTPMEKQNALDEAKKFVKNNIEVEGNAIERPEMIVSKTQLKDMLSGLEEKVISMKVILKNNKMYLHFQKDYGGGRKTNILLRPSAIGLVEDNIEIGDILKIDIEKLKPKGTSVRAVDSSGGVLASKGSQTMGKFEQRTNQPKESLVDDFKLFQHVNEMIQKYAERVGEQYLPRGAKGVYYHGTTKNIRLTNMNELSTAAHEISHYIDERFAITPKFREIIGYTELGMPIYDPKTAKERKELTDLYTRYYPGGKKEHKLKKRMTEGFATLIQKYVEMPTTITQNYPNLVKKVLTQGGEFYNDVIGEMIRDLGKIVEDYQALSALDKVGAVVTSNKNKVLKDSFLNLWERIRTIAVDNIYPIESLAKDAGVWMTNNDPSLWLRMYNSSTTYMMNNILGNRGFWRYKGGEIVKVNDSNWKTLNDRLKKEQTFDAFGDYLVARDEQFQYKKLNKLKEKADTDAKIAKEEKTKLSEEPDPEEIAYVRSLETVAKKSKEDYEDLKSVLDKNEMDEKTVTQAYEENKEKFKEEEDLYDSLVKEDVEFAHDPDIGLLNDDRYEIFKEREGYAPRRHEFYDDILGDEEITSTTPGGTKISVFKSRKGSGRTVLHPMESSIKAHAEIVKKGLKQLVYNKIAENIADKFPALFQVQQLQAIPDKNTGAIIFPQEKDKNIIMAIVGGKRKPILVDKYVKSILDDVLTYNDVHIIGKLFMATSRIFTKGTTAAYPQFVLTNIAMDTISSSAQTNTKMMPLVSAIKELSKAIIDKTSIEAQYLKEYMMLGGDRQTLVGYQNMSASELLDGITNERKGLLHGLDLLNKGAEILSIPSQYSEIMTRSTEYIRARKMGDAQVVALEKAGRVSAPFHHIGTLGGKSGGKIAVKTIPFFNPMLQVLDQTARTMETPEGRQRAGFVMAVLVALMAGGTAATIIGGSDKQKRMLSDIDPKEIGMYIYFPTPDGEGLGKIRVPENYSWFGTIVNMLIIDKTLNANYTSGEYFSGGTAFLPNQLKPWQTNEFLWSYVPQFAKTGLLVSANKKDFPKIMDLETQGMLAKEPRLRYTDASSIVAKWMGNEFNMSPVKIDALMTGVFGRASGFLTLKPSAYGILPTMKREEYFDSGRTMQLYYEIKKKNDETVKSIKNRLREFTPEEKSEQLKLNHSLSQIDKLINDYRDVDAEKYPEREEKLKQTIYKLINDKLR